MRQTEGCEIMEITEFEYDILNEIFNIGVGKAADLLSQILNKKIILHIPHILLIDSPDNFTEEDERLKELMDGTLMVSSITFSEQLKGMANLVFPADKMNSFIGLCTGEPCSSAKTTADFTDIDFDIIREIGNIVLNSIVGEFGNHLELTLDYTLPVVKVYDKQIDFHNDIETSSYKSVLIMSVTFVIDDVEIEGAILIDLTMTSCQKLLHLLRRIEANLCE